MVNNFLANSKNQQKLSEHLIAVGELARAIVHDTLQHPNEMLEVSAYVAGLLHDIGKVDNDVQKNIIKSIAENNGIKVEKEKKTKKEDDRTIIYHNERSLAIFDRFENTKLEILNSFKPRDRDIINNIIRYAIYWHHAERLDMHFKNTNEINIDGMENDIADVMKDIGIQAESDDFFHFGGGSFPNFIDENEKGKTNPQSFYILYAVCTADRIISQINGNELHELVNSKNYIQLLSSEEKSINYDIANATGLDIDRLRNQESIAKQSLESKTMQLNAPTGFGKTLVMLLRILQSGKRTYIVAPRNLIANNIYDEMIKYMEAFGLKREDLSIELYLGSKKQKSNEILMDEEHSFDSHIVVTNIDQYIKSFNDTDKFYRNENILNADLIIDECHELISDSALFAVTLSVLRMRHMYVKKATTLLVSATASLMADLIGNGIAYLPERGKHYPASHGKKYTMLIESTPPNHLDDLEVCILNTIRNVQSYHNKHNTEDIMHSGYMKRDLDQIKDSLIRKYGKNKGNTKDTTVGSLIMQASLNISFHNMYESCLSPEDTLQRLGRCNRFGEYDDSIFTSFLWVENGENQVCTLRYNTPLKKIWFKFFSDKLKENNHLNLNDIYLLYNEFNEEYQEKILQYLNDSYGKGIVKYNQGHLQPKKINKPNDNVDKCGVKSFGGLRNPSCGYFIAPKALNPKTHKAEYIRHAAGDDSDSINIQYEMFIKHWNDSNLSGRGDKFWVGEINKLIGIGYEKWNDVLESKEYTKFKNKKKYGKSDAQYFDDKRLKEFAKWSETPLPGINYLYDNNIGLIDECK